MVAGAAWRSARVVVGTRSAVFAPLENLGLIIVDEEQENSFKQEETPRYHGRDVAIVRAKMENALALLGSATPSLETYHHAREGKYELLTLASRVANRSTRERRNRRLARGFSTARTRPARSVRSAVRGAYRSAWRTERRRWCSSTGAVIRGRCSAGAAGLRAMRELQHLDDAITSTATAWNAIIADRSSRCPKVCPKCQSKYVYFFGEGSEHLEERLRKEFPGARIAQA